VNTLQQFLIFQGKGPAAQALASNGATMYFGVLTRAALAEFQKSVGITPAIGYFGPITRAFIDSLPE
jgi:peptidoglycan hydrolase-like protein with peptidoglycan-binding domain